LCATVCCSVLLCATVCCSVLLCATVCCSVLLCATVCCSMLLCATVCCSVLLCATVCCSVLLCAALCMHVTGICALTHTKANVLFSKQTHTCHDSFTCVVHICAMTHLPVAYICAKAHTRWQTRWFVLKEDTHVPWLIHMSCTYMCHDSFTCDVHICAMTHLHVMYIYVPWLTAQEWRNRTLVGHDPLMCSKMYFTKTTWVQW